MDASRYRAATSRPEDSDAGTLLVALGVAPGPCTLSLTPEELSFGEVPPGSIGILPFEVSNTGQNFCVVSGVALAPSSDPAFLCRRAGRGPSGPELSGKCRQPVRAADVAGPRGTVRAHDRRGGGDGNGRYQLSKWRAVRAVDRADRLQPAGVPEHPADGRRFRSGGLQQHEPADLQFRRARA